MPLMFTIQPWVFEVMKHDDPKVDPLCVVQGNSDSGRAVKVAKQPVELSLWQFEITTEYNQPTQNSI